MTFTVASMDIKSLIENASQETLHVSGWMRIERHSPNPQKSETMVIGHSLQTKHPSISESLVLNNTVRRE